MDLTRSTLLRTRHPLWHPPDDDGGNGTPGETPTAGTTAAPEITVVPTTAAPISPAAFSQDEVNRLVAKARDEGRKTAQDEAKRKAAEEEAARKGEWEKLAQDRQAEIDGLKAQLASRDRDLLVAKVAHRHKLPPEIAARLQGDSEEDLDADAKALAKVVVPKRAHDTESGAGNGEDPQKGGLPIQRKRADGPLFAFDGVTPKVPWPTH